MPIPASCVCGKQFQAKDELAGKRVRCPACGGVIEIPFAATASDDPLGLGDYGANTNGMAAPTTPYGGYQQPAHASPAKSRPAGGLPLVLLMCVGGAVLVIVVAVGLGLLLLRGSDETVANAHASPEATVPDSHQRTGSSLQPVAASSPVAKAEPSPASIPWTVIADPPREALSIPQRVDINIPIPEQGYYMVYPATPSPFVAVGLNSIGKPGAQSWNVLKGEKLGELTAPVSGTDFALSPDGVHLAIKDTTAGVKGKLKLLSFKTGEQAGEVAFGGDYLQYVEFTTGNSLVTHSWGTGSSGYEYAIRTWSIPDGKQLQEIQVPRQYQKGLLALSPGGRYLAAVEGTDKLSIFDLKEGKLAGFRLITQLTGKVTGSLLGMSFSADGTQLGFVYASTNSVVVLLDVASGKVADTIDFAGKPPTAPAYRGDAIEWLGERGWCLFGGTVIDRQTKRVVWNLHIPFGGSLGPRKTLPGGWILDAGPHARKSLRFVNIPVAEIDASLGALAGQSQAYLKPGASVSVDITIGQLKHGTSEDTKQRLTDLFTERFAGDKITVADGQPLTLKVHYHESEGETLQESEGITRKATGRTVQATKVHLQMNLVASAGSASFFTHEIEYDPHMVTVMAKEATESNVRDSIFRQLLYRLSAAPIPYFVPQEPGMSQLPGIAKVE